MGLSVTRVAERPGAYLRRRPETPALYELVRDNLETLYGAIDDGALEVRGVHAVASGSQLLSRPPDGNGYFMLRLGAVQQRAQLVPKVQGWCRSALPWVMDIRAIPQRDTQ